MNSLGFTGSRIGITDEQDREIVRLLKELSPEHIHHGDCVGSDETFHEICDKSRPRPIIHVHPPTENKWRAYCEGDVTYEPKTYLKRNRDIVRMSDALIATPSSFTMKARGSGTWTTIGYARERGIPIYIVYPNGEVALPGE